MAIITLQKLA